MMQRVYCSRDDETFGQKSSMEDLKELVPVGEGGPREAEPATKSAPATLPYDGDNFALRTMRTRAEIEAIQRALGHTGWNRSQAARLLKISYRSLLLKIQRHKITHDSR